MLVEDEELIRRLLARVLEGAGYDVHTAASGEEAMTLVSKHAGELTLLLTDLVMPGMNGLELARAARELQPELPVLCMSGYSEETLRDRGSDAGEVGFIEKPFAPGELIDQVTALLRESESQRIRARDFELE